MVVTMDNFLVYAYVIIKLIPDLICIGLDLVAIFDYEDFLIDYVVILLLESCNFNKRSNFCNVLFAITIYINHGNWYLKDNAYCIPRGERKLM